MHFGFALEFSDIDLLNTDLLDTHLDLLSRDKYADIPSKYFASLHKIFKRSSRHVFKTSSRHVFKTSSRYIFKTSSRHVFKTSCKRSSKRLQDVFKTSWQDVFKTSWKTENCYAEDVLKTSSRPTNVCWVIPITPEMNIIDYQFNLSSWSLFFHWEKKKE